MTLIAVIEGLFCHVELPLILITVSLILIVYYQNGCVLRELDRLVVLLVQGGYLAACTPAYPDIAHRHG